ncbi:single-stranded DNA-binding protein [Galbitalea sp. SE-J8]|uniref:single-stranded DNA-binding protein n=1 Tax=Galbitalea sp. SE-J8 TaxID=3054952 RepID=UPI00259CD14D|nr:single-stranded DNA-binding protein [Galbitalea sp. SE-J8]MDM4764351.1 single-stranded DNA-binding protein [Galbitalea sp. SE-J8]
MSDTITVVGFIATEPRHLVTNEGLPITSFRLASTARRFDRSKNEWVDGDTNWFTVTAFRQLALNANASLQKGHRVVVAGRLRVRGWEAGDKTGTTVEIDADAIGHDLLWGTSKFVRNLGPARGGTDAVVAPAVDEQFPQSFDDLPAPTEAEGVAESDGPAALAAAAGPLVAVGADDDAVATPF